MEPTGIISILQRRRVDPAHLLVTVYDMPPGHQGGTLDRTTHTSRTKTVYGCSDDYIQVVAAQQDPGDEVYELTERDGYVTIHRDGKRSRLSSTTISI